MKKLILLSLLLCSCARVQEYSVSRYKKQCVSYGFQENTPEMAQCILAVDQAYNTYGMGLMGMGSQLQQAHQPTTLKMNCMTSQMGNAGSINCY